MAMIRREQIYFYLDTFDFKAARQRLAELPELEQVRVEGMIAELMTVHGVGRMLALEIVIKTGRFLRRQNGND